MTIKKRNLKIFIRILTWLTYLLSGIFLYTKSSILPLFLETFAKLFYPLSIFWLQIRIKNKEPWLLHTDSVSISQLWIRLIPIVVSLFTFIIVLLNLLFKLIFVRVSNKIIENVIL